jgi:hypothetical protein
MYILNFDIYHALINVLKRAVPDETGPIDDSRYGNPEEVPGKKKRINNLKCCLSREFIY